MEQVKKRKPQFWREKRLVRERLRFNNDFYVTAQRAQKQVKNLLLNSSKPEREKLQRYIRPVSAETIRQAVNLDKRIRGIA